MIRIILPTDFSSNAWNAISYATHLFEKEQCTFYILHAVQVGPSNLSNTINKERNTRLYEISLKEAERKLKRLMQQIQASKENPRHHFESILIFDSILNAIGKTINAHAADYVCMGTQGSSAVKEIFMGSTTVSVIKNINFCPIIAVPENYEYEKPDEICFATNFRRYYENVELHPLLVIAKLWDTLIKIIHVKQTRVLDDNQEKHLEFLKERIQGLRYVIEETYETQSIAASITQIANNPQTDMLAMINNKHDFLSKLIREPVIKRVMFQSKVPFLVLPEVN